MEICSNLENYPHAYTVGMFTFRPIQSADSIIEYHRDSFSEYYIGKDDSDQNARWIGVLADELLPPDELNGKPSKDAFAKLLKNLHPKTGEKLTVRTRQKRRSGFDFACCAPKSVSMAHIMRGDNILLKIHKECANEAFKFLEEHAATRIRKDGDYKDRCTGSLIAFATEHESSRHGDPHLHTHFVVPNITWDAAEKRYKALQTSEIAQNIGLATAIYRNTLAQKLRALGYGLSYKADGKFEIEGVPPSLIKEYSKSKNYIDEKTSEIETKLGFELEESVRRDIALGLRPKKLTKLGERIAFYKFRKRINESGVMDVFHPKKGVSLKKNSGSAEDFMKKAMDFAVEHLFERNSVTKKSKLKECAINALQGLFSYKNIEDELNNRVASQELFYNKREGLVVSKEIWELERKLLMYANKGVGNAEQYAKLTGRKWKLPDSLSPEQKACLEYVMYSRDKVMNIQGIAGAGKSFLLQTLAVNLGNNNINFVAVAPSSKATAELNDLGHEHVQTMQSLIAQGGSYKLRDGLLIVDEAGLVGVRDMVRLFEIASKYNARILFTGDIRQHKSVPAGDALRLLQTRSKMETFSLREIRRQKDKEYRDAVYSIFKGDVNNTMAKLRKNKAIEKFSHEYMMYMHVAGEYIIAEKDGKNTLIVSPVWSEIEEITRIIQGRLYQMGYLKRSESKEFKVAKSLSWTHAQKKERSTYDLSNDLYLDVFGKVEGVQPGVYRVSAGKEEYLLLEDRQGQKVRLAYSEARNFDVQQMGKALVAPKEKLLIRGNLKVGQQTVLKRGEIVIVKKLAEDGTILLEDGRKIPLDFLSWTHGYAITSHASQGMTVDNVIFACGSHGLKALTQEQFYVGISRGRESVKVLTTDIKELTQKVGCTNNRMLAVEFMQEMLDDEANIGKYPSQQSQQEKQTSSLKPIFPSKKSHNIPSDYSDGVGLDR